MAYPTKIATCCHCGSKAALTLGKGRHELSCASCGAPLRIFKRLPVVAKAKPAVSHQPRAREDFRPRKSKFKPKDDYKRKKKYKTKKRGAWIKSLVEEAFDFIEDIFD